MEKTAAAVVLLALVAAAEGFCYRKNPPRSQESAELLLQPGNYSIWVCINSTTITADLERAPKANISQIQISMSTVEKLKPDAFARFAECLVNLKIWRSQLAEIDDGALKGLKELRDLSLAGNELTALKASWFKDTTKLRELNLMHNRIRRVEVESFKLLPALVSLDLRGNEILALPVEFFKQLPTTLCTLYLFGNPLNDKQTYEAVEWGKTKDDKTNLMQFKCLKHMLNVTKGCLEDKTIPEKTNEVVEKCVEDRLNGALALIAGNKTVLTTR